MIRDLFGLEQPQRVYVRLVLGVEMEEMHVGCGSGIIVHSVGSSDVLEVIVGCTGRRWFGRVNFVALVARVVLLARVC